MTLHLLDIASYQGALSTADVVRAGFGAVNLKVSHGLSRKAVHPDVAGWVDRARAANLGISTFHYLVAGDGVAQAEYAYARIAELGLLHGTAHQLDVECDPAPRLADVRAYLERMMLLLDRPVALYTGDWWWTARPGWNVSDLSPYLWSAPNAGYLKTYPGDASASWIAGYGGWPTLSVMQYAVAPLLFPDGTKGSIDVSKSAIREPAVWHDLTLGRPGMTVAPATLRAERTFYINTLALAGYRIDPLSVGIVGDGDHANQGTSYHLGKSALKPTAYSVVESPRDRAGLSEAASGIDLGWFSITVKGKTHNLRTYSAWLVKQCQANTPDTRDIREVIYSLDGQTVKRWDRLEQRTTGDSSHTSHTHESWFRDSETRDKTAHLRRYFTEIGLLEGDDMTPAEATEWLKTSGARAAIWDATFGWDRIQGYDANGVPVPEDPADPLANTMTSATAVTFAARFERMAMPKINALGTAVAALSTAVAAIGKNVVADDDDLAAIQASIAAASAATVDAVVAEMTAAGRSDEDVAAALKAALGDRAAAIGALLR